jgi:hypothetical protein
MCASLGAADLAIQAYSKQLSAGGGGSTGCGPINEFQRCITALNMGEPSTSDIFADHADAIQRCEVGGEAPTFQTVDGTVKISVDSRRSVEFHRRSAASVDVWELADKVEANSKMGDTFEARFADAKTTVNQLAIDAVKECNALGPSLEAKLKAGTDKLDKVASDLEASVGTEIGTLKEYGALVFEQTFPLEECCWDACVLLGLKPSMRVIVLACLSDTPFSDSCHRKSCQTTEGPLLKMLPLPSTLSPR